MKYIFNEEVFFNKFKGYLCSKTISHHFLKFWHSKQYEICSHFRQLLRNVIREKNDCNIFCKEFYVLNLCCFSAHKFINTRTSKNSISNMESSINSNNFFSKILFNAFPSILTREWVKNVELLITKC